MATPTIISFPVLSSFGEKPVENPCGSSDRDNDGDSTSFPFLLFIQQSINDKRVMYLHDSGGVVLS